MTDSIRAAAEKLVQLLDAAPETPGAPSDDECIAGVEALDNLRAALAQPEEGVLTDEELNALMPQQMRTNLEAAAAARAAELGFNNPSGIFQFSVYKEARAYARAVEAAVIARRPAPEPPAEGEVGELSVELISVANALAAEGLTGSAEPCRRAADLLAHRHPAPVPVSERLPGHIEQALIKAECALSDIAEGEPEENEGDSDALLSWAEKRAAVVLARIRPVMREHGIRTSEWPPLPATALPLPAGEVE